MKINIFSILLLISITLIHNLKAECEGEARQFNCGTAGTPHFYRNSEGDCSFGCKNEDRILNCEESHPPPDLLEYKNEHCQEKAYDCKDKGKPVWIEYDNVCDFHCTKRDVVYLCDVIYSRYY
ncbi:hypothetical protein ILUMI_15561 [Ignelater luminosus]|uniref:Uncharacterized protein n=1 Tax=Ignelater luminosus TaxID=2038154 RepID=A0A8K0CSN6_IGNLU|nr:hypothetical protein ILUMI_15561 [Ignelater luminosus]